MTDHSLELSIIESILGERTRGCGAWFCLGHWIKGKYEIVISIEKGRYVANRSTKKNTVTIANGDFEHLISKISDPEFRKTL